MRLCLVTVAERKLQCTHDRAIRDPLLRRVRGRREDNGTRGTRLVGDRLRQPALADPGLSHEHRDSTLARNAAPDGVDVAKGRIPTNERQALGVERRLWCRMRFSHRRMRDHRCLPVADGFISSGRLGKRVDAQLALQDRDARAVLAHRAGPVAGRGEELHPPDMRRLVERVEVDPPSGSRDRRGKVAVRFESRDEPVEHTADGPLDRGSPRRAPVVELGAVAEREPRHERAARQLGGGCEVGRVT